MEIKKELVKKVKDRFGLNVYETKVWLALVSKGIASSSEISTISGVPRSRTYDVLSSLEKKGFAIAKVGKPTKYISVEPVNVLDKLKNNVFKEAEEKIDILDNLKNSKEYGELESLHNSALEPIKKEELSSILKGRTNVYVHFKNLLGKVKKSIVVYLPVSEVEEKSRIFKDIFSKIKNCKAESKIFLYGEEDRIKEINRKYGVNSKPTSINASFLMADDKVLFLLSEKMNEDNIGINVVSDFFANSLNQLIKKTFD